MPSDVHVSGKMLNLAGVSGILKQHCVPCIHTDSSLESALVKHIKGHCNDGYIFVMTPFCKEVSYITLQVPLII